MQPVLLAFLMTLLAGLATGIGSAIAFFAHRTSHRFLSVATGFSAGVMLYVAFVEIFSKATVALVEAWGERPGAVGATLSFFAGILLIFLIDRLVPDADNPHEVRSQLEVDGLQRDAKPTTQKNLLRMGIFTAIAITIHNFPEGLATFMATLMDPRVGVAIAVAVALHNIPEGISVSVPIFYATGNRRKAFLFSFASGMAEPVGAVVGYLVLRPFLGPAVLGCLFGLVAGIMVFISLDELLPTSRAYGKGHDSLWGLVGGMALMATSLLLLK
jgi:ZIP family zinc transporter